MKCSLCMLPVVQRYVCTHGGTPYCLEEQRQTAESIANDLRAEVAKLKTERAIHLASIAEHSQQLAAARAALDGELASVARVTATKDAAYHERDQVVAALAALAAISGWPVWLAAHVGPWEDDWRNIVFIGTPHGQVSWHYHYSERELFSMYKSDQSTLWDGHSTEEKYARLSRLGHDARRAAEAITVPPNRTGTPEESQAIADWHHDEINRRAAEAKDHMTGVGKMAEATEGGLRAALAAVRGERDAAIEGRNKAIEHAERLQRALDGERERALTEAADWFEADGAVVQHKAKDGTVTTFDVAFRVAEILRRRAAEARGMPLGTIVVKRDGKVVGLLNAFDDEAKGLKS